MPCTSPSGSLRPGPRLLPPRWLRLVRRVVFVNDPPLPPYPALPCPVLVAQLLRDAARQLRQEPTTCAGSVGPADGTPLPYGTPVPYKPVLRRAFWALATQMVSYGAWMTKLPSAQRHHVNAWRKRVAVGHRSFVASVR
jgi:hypothetical protein